MTRVPFDPSRSLIVIKATIYGHGRARTIDLALDLGASTTTIPTDIVLGLGYDPAASTRRVRIISASRLAYCSVVTVARIEAIGQSVNDIDVICHDLPEESHIYGLLGLNVLRHFDQTIRYSCSTHSEGNDMFDMHWHGPNALGREAVATTACRILQHFAP
jgi:Aspartyl protease